MFILLIGLTYFTGTKIFNKKAIYFGEHPESLLIRWRDFYFWQWAKNKKEPHLPFFEKHHKAIDEFKVIVQHLDQVYGTKSVVEIIKPVTNEKFSLPFLDIIFRLTALLRCQI